MLNVYTTFHRADGHVVKMHMDQWEGQDFPVSPGNLYSEPRKIHVDPASNEPIRLVLDRKIPPIEMPKDTPCVKHVRFESPLLSKFWGRPILIGATILLPKDYDRDSGVHYPVNYEQGHFSTQRAGRIRGDAPAQARRHRAGEKRVLAGAEEFSKAWQSGSFPRMLFVTFQHPTPYYDDSYAIDSPNMGPYGQAITQELIPYIEKHFRAIPQPWARILSGGSTGGWESLALQIFYPDYFGGTFSYCPDPVDFHYFEMVNIYEWDNAWYPQGRLAQDADPRRAPAGRPRPLDHARAAEVRTGHGHGRAFRRRLGLLAGRLRTRVGANGYFQPLFDPATGAIDHGVAAYWKEHTDLNAYLQRNWKEIGPKLAGKIHIWTGDMDTYYLNNAVYLLEDYLKTTTSPPWGGSITYGPREPHCWVGALPPRRAPEDDGRLRRRHGAPRRGSAVVARVARGDPHAALVDLLSTRDLHFDVKGIQSTASKWAGGANSRCVAGSFPRFTTAKPTAKRMMVKTIRENTPGDRFSAHGTPY